MTQRIHVSYKYNAQRQTGLKTVPYLGSKATVCDFESCSMVISIIYYICSLVPYLRSIPKQVARTHLVVFQISDYSFKQCISPALHRITTQRSVEDAEEVERERRRRARESYRSMGSSSTSDPGGLSLDNVVLAEDGL
jgi:hypothetical protein